MVVEWYYNNEEHESVGDDRTHSKGQGQWLREWHHWVYMEEHSGEDQGSGQIQETLAGSAECARGTGWRWPLALLAAAVLRDVVLVRVVGLVEVISDRWFVVLAAVAAVGRAAGSQTVCKPPWPVAR